MSYMTYDSVWLNKNLWRAVYNSTKLQTQKYSNSKISNLDFIGRVIYMWNELGTNHLFYYGW